MFIFVDGKDEENEEDGQPDFAVTNVNEPKFLEEHQMMNYELNSMCRDPREQEGQINSNSIMRNNTVIPN